MKSSKKNDKTPAKQSVIPTKKSPEIRDDLDSRERKDVGYKEHSNKEGKKPNSRDKNKYGN